MRFDDYPTDGADQDGHCCLRLSPDGEVRQNTHTKKNL